MTTNYLELDDYMILLDDASLNKLTTAQLMQRLKSHGLEYKAFKHVLIKRWQNYKYIEQKILQLEIQETKLYTKILQTINQNNNLKYKQKIILNNDYPQTWDQERI